MTSSEASARPSIRVALKLPFATDQVADYLFEPDVVHEWLASDAEISPELESRAYMPNAAVDGSWQNGFRDRLFGRVSSLDWPAAGHSRTGRKFELVVTLDTGAAITRVTFRLSPSSPDGTCRLRIEQSGLTSNVARHASVKFWQRVLHRFDGLLALAERSRRHERQAVIVVHGIGEQRPGQLLREFVANVFNSNADEQYFVKPDYISPLFEMRMATVPRSDATRPTTDVYELYWAHLIRDTTVAQVYSWMLRLMLSLGSKIPKSLIRLVWTLRSAFVVVVLLVGWLAIADVSSWIKYLGGGILVALPAIAKFALTAGNKFIVGYAGDAARYLEPRPDNITRRQEIREAGAKLLNALHDKGRYSRIIVYGHSLGSVIAYDILSHAWAQRSRHRDAVPRTSSRALRALEDLLNQRAGHAQAVSVDEVQAMQHTAWLEYRRNGFQWRVSDFVTAGSPLAHAHWLLNLDATTQFANLVRERSFPTCPPQTESVASPARGIRRQAFTFTHAYDNDQSWMTKRSVQVPHHGGLFALTRWTNLYFPYRGIFDGDPVGGPLGEQFGTWIKDIRLSDTKGFAHCRYTARTLEPEAVAQVRSALNLPLQRSIAEYLAVGLQPTVPD